MKVRLDQLPAGAYQEQLRVRSYEIGRDGATRPATLFRYLENLATEASAYAGFEPDWYVQQGTAWVVHTMDLFIGQMPRFGDHLGLATWVAEFRRVQAIRDYAIWNMATGALLARASARWAYVDRFRAVPVRLPEAMTTSMPTYGHGMRKRTLTPHPRDTETIATTFDHTAREYEVDSQQHVNNCAYVDWLWDAAHSALNGAVPVSSSAYQPRYYSLEYVKTTLPDEHIQIVTNIRPAAVTPRQNNPSIQIAQEVRHTATDAVCLRATTTYLRPTTRPA